jgi:hypothetical protein
MVLAVLTIVLYVCVFSKIIAGAAEEDIMGHYPQWKVGLNVYKSGIYVPPTLNKGFPEELMQN